MSTTWSEPVAWGEVWGSWGDPFPDLETLPLVQGVITATAHSRNGAFLSDLPRLVGWRWTDQVSPLGGAEVTLPADDERATPSILADGNLIVLRLDGAPVAGLRIEPPSRRDLVSTGARTVTVAGRSALALLDDARVYPERGPGRLEPQQRPLNWSARDWIQWSSGAVWGTPNTHGTQASPANPNWAGFPESWPAIADHAQWMWAGPSSTRSGAPSYVYEAFDAYFRRTLTLAADEDVIIAATADDEIRVLVDGQEVISTQGPAQWRQTFVWRGRLGSGDHQIAVRGRNLPRNTGTYRPASPAGVLLAMGRHDAAGDMTTVFGVSQGSDWLAAGNLASPPGMTPGRSIGVLKAEAQARGCLTGLADDFSEEEASPRPGQAIGEQWLEDEDRVVDCGRSLLDVTTAIASSTVDVDVSLIPNGRDVIPTLRLWGHNRRYRDLTTGDAPVVLKDGRDIVSMTAERPDVVETVLLVDTPDGWTEAVDPLAATDRREGHIKLGEHEQPESAETAIDVELAKRVSPHQVATVVMADEPLVRPYQAFDKGDLILAPSYSDPTQEVAWRVLSISCQGSGGDATPKWTLELGPRP